MRRRLGLPQTAHGRDIVPILAVGAVVETRRSGQTPWRTDVPPQMSIPGFVAVASVGRPDELPQDDVDRLATAYEAICGRAARRTSYACAFAQAIEFGRDAVSAAPAPSESESWTVLAGVLHGDKAGTTPDPAVLDGQFALATYDEPSRTLAVASDPFGMFPLFRASRDGRHYFSTSALALAKHLAAPADVLGLFAFLRTGYHFGTRTHWLGVERLDPGHRVLLEPARVRVERYWQPEPDEAVTRLELHDAARFCTEVCVDTFSKLYRREEAVWADLTGGYDSRLLTLALSRAAVRFRANTVGADWTEDVRIARDVAEAAGLPWTTFPPPTDPNGDFTERFRRALAAGHGHLDAIELARVLATHEAKRLDLPRLLTGGGGEHFQYYAWQTEFTRAGRSAQVNLDNWVRMRLLGSFDTSIFARYPASEVERDLRDRCVAWIAPYRNEVNTRQLDLLYAYKMMGHFGAFTGAASSVLPTELPFYMRPVFLAAFSTNHRHRNGHRLMQRMIEQLDPRAAAVRTTRGGPAQPMRMTNLHRFWPYYARLASKALEKATGLRIYRPRAEQRVAASPELRLAALQAVLGDDARSMRSRALFRPAQLDLLLAEAARPDFERSQLFGRIVTVEAALRTVDAEVPPGGRP